MIQRLVLRPLDLHLGRHLARRLELLKEGASYPSIITGAAAILFAVFLGLTVGRGRPEVAMIVVSAIFGLAVLRHLTVPGWVGLLLLTAVGMRWIVATLGLPQSLNFLHYAVVAGFAIAALQQPYRAGSHAPSRWLLGFLLLTLTSMLVMDSHPVRAFLFLIITGEPLLVIWSVSRFRIGPGERRQVGVIVVVFAAVQLPIGLAQGLGGGFGDPVQGTLLGHGAGHHVLGGLFAVLLIIVVTAVAARRLAASLGMVAAALCLGMMFATGSMAVTVLTAGALLFVPVLAGRQRGGSDEHGGMRVLRATVASAAVAVAALFLVQAIVPDIYERAGRLVSIDELPEVEMAVERADRDLDRFLFGSGPGTSASRASVLLIAAEDKEGSPLLLFGLGPTEEGLEIWNATRDEHGGSAERIASSALSIIGDLGMFGVVALVALFVAIWRRASRSSDWLGPAAQGALILTAMLIFVSQWLEYPEYAVPLAILLGLVLQAGSPRPRLEQPL